MRRWTLLIVLMAGVTVLASSHGSPEDEVIKAIENNWKNAREGNYAAMVEGRGDSVAMQAGSEGGFWEAWTASELQANLERRPYRLNVRPYHIRVMFLGSAKDVAYATYYLAGSLEGETVNVNDYRTRVSSVMEKTEGRWVELGSHYSRLFEGSGVPD